MKVPAATDDWNQVLQSGKVCLFLFVDWSLQARASRRRVQEVEQQCATDPSLQEVHWWMVDGSDDKINGGLRRWLQAQDPTGQGPSRAWMMGAGALVWIEEGVCRDYRLYAAAMSEAELIRVTQQVFKIP